MKYNALRDEREFEDRVAIVIGASSGIGLSVATALASQGAKVIMFARSQERMDEICRSHPGRMIAVSGDATRSEISTDSSRRPKAVSVRANCW